MRRALAIAVGGIPIWIIVLAGIIFDPKDAVPAFIALGLLVAITIGSAVLAQRIMDKK